MSNLTVVERERLARFKAAYSAGTETGTDAPTGNRLAFMRWLVATGDVTDMDGAEWCAACGRPLLYLPGHLVVLLQAGLPANPIRCLCGTLTIPSEGGRLVPPHGEAA